MPGDSDNRSEIRDFLATRRAKITPEQVGLPSSGRRRVPGLRREEVAVLAGVSPDWYIRLEKGHILGVSDDVLDAVARALQLTDAECEHLFNLARAAKPARTPRRRGKTAIPPSVQRVLDSMSGTAAFVRNGRLDILAGNALARALYSPVLDDPAHRGNIARFDFLDPRASDYYPDHDGALAVAVALLRTEAGRNPHDPDLTALVGELATRSEAFRTRWGTHDVRLHRGGTKQFNHPAGPASKTAKAPDAAFTRDVYVNPIKQKTEPSRLIASLVRFTPGARTNWHSHALGQTLHCTDGTGLVVSRDGTVIHMRAGDTVWTPPGEEHWHGGTTDNMMCHLAMLEGTEDGDGTTWLEPVEQYQAAHHS
jgi:quercetin dioxygenase-like cupin family protein/transcriptional regulator with XRE-family HTH domain